MAADPAATAIAREQSFRSALLELGDQLLNIADPSEMGYAAAAIAGRTLGVCRAGYGTIDAARGVVEVARDWTIPGYASLAGLRRFLDDRGYSERLLRGEPIIYADTERDAPAESVPAWLAVGAHAVVNLPVFEQGHLVAVIYLHHPQPRQWQAEEIAFLRNVADRTRSAVERRRAERSLLALNETLERQVADRTADRNRLWRLSAEIMLVMQPDGVLLSANPAWTATLGWAEADLSGRMVLDLVHPDDRAAGAANLRSLAGGTAVTGAVSRMRHRDGTYRWIAWNAVPGGGVISAVGRDFTVEHDKGAALAASEARLRSIFDTSFQFLGLVAPDGTLLDANPTSLAAIGARLDDVAGQDFWETPWFAATEGLPDQVQAAVQRVLSGHGVRQEITANLPAGARTFDMSMRVVRDAGGRVIAIVAEAVDLTEQRAAEAQLRQALKMEAIGQLTGGVAHDFNNLLQSMQGSLELVRRRIGQGRLEEASRFAGSAQTTIERAAALTHRLLAFARRQALAPKAVAPNDLIAGMAELISRTVGASITVEVDAGEGVWPVLCDPNQLENALLNLAINARDAMADRGRLAIRTSCVSLAARDIVAEEEVQPGDYVRITVADTGSGMDAATQARAFEPFFTTKPIGQGSGLGLSQIYGFVRQSCGFVRLDSAPGQGTTVCLYLPRHLAAAAEDRQPAGAPEPGPGGPGEIILLVEDEPELRDIVGEQLREFGYTVLEAADGASALDVLRLAAQVPRVLVTDIGLPGGLNGRQLAEAACALLPGLPVLFMTGYAGRALDAELAPGMQVLAKPFAFADLIGKIQAMLSG